ncbi:zinc-dependent metalloprotease family protein [Mesonia sp. MT50]|uniref:Zinc-dependent metalloprotease family protein n=1 Tax=Mesonia profundi TaxID=3070998 RepID=A0ABU1A3Z9_9FLAO|nr:zinc-dependent metalloprotease family protein [Mesonia profundi]MDQ7918435.1 zinc-dependent metalloprotease family protein [Mesonia profundi]
MRTNLRHVLGLVLFFLAFSVSGQNNYWTKTTDKALSQLEKTRRASTPTSYHVYHLDLEAFKAVIAQAPERGNFTGDSPVVIELPMENGKLEKFKVASSSIMEEELQNKFANIRTYKAIGINDPTATVRFSVTQFGLHSMSLSGKRSATYIDPYTTDKENYIIYNRKDLTKTSTDFECLTENNIDLPSLNGNAGKILDTDDNIHRTYRLAQSCTAEYGNIFANAGTEVADIQAQMTITMNRVNEIYERDLAITLIFVANNDEIIYYGATNSDPWNGEYNNTTQTVIDNEIGDANYDIGHNFNTSGGGNAGCIGCVCTSGSKGSGFTGSSNPTGDPFDIDYVAHEMGHQFGGYHTMNTCSRSGSGQTEVEPASGSSILGYAGICPTNVQANSDAHFNYVNIRDISANVQSGVSSSCAVEVSIPNQAPVADAGTDYTIPKSTAYILKGSATDPDGTTTHTYNWSQNDPEMAPGSGSPQPTWTQGPLYRSIMPTESPNRYMPKLEDVVNGNLTPTWEVTPSVTREMNFAFTVRDNGSGFAEGVGQTDVDLMKVNVDATAGPFVVTSQNSTGITWNVGENQTITWDVANTDSGSINAANVNILMSVDGGLNFDVIVAEDLPNNGSASVVVPSVGTIADARIMVEAADNIFYAVNEESISVQEAEFVIDLDETTVAVCQPDDAVYNFTYNTFLGFTETTTFSTTGLPSGLTATFTPETATANDTDLSLTITGTASVDVGTYEFEIVGTSTSVTTSFDAVLQVFDANIEAPNLLTPTDGETDVPATPVLTWESSDNVEFYTLQIATDTDFTTIVEEVEVNDNTYAFSSAQNETTYYWKIMASNSCDDTSFSDVFSFTTTSCELCESSGTTQYGTSITLVNFNNINNASGKPSGYSDYTDISTGVAFGESYGLTINLNTDGNYPLGAMVWIDWNQNCSFDDPGEEYNLGVASNGSDIPTNNSPMSITIPTDALEGNTIMRVSTQFNAYPTSCNTGFDGEVEDYTLTVGELATDDASLASSFSIWPNPNNGEFNISLNATNPQPTTIQVYDVAGRLVHSRKVEAQHRVQESISLAKAQAGVYFVRVSDKNNSITKKIIVQ